LFHVFLQLLPTVTARPRAGILLALACQTARMLMFVLTCHIVTTACLGLTGVIACATFIQQFSL